jgi:D-alanyl-D-alanine carboxypeptidase
MTTYRAPRLALLRAVTAVVAASTLLIGPVARPAAAATRASAPHGNSAVSVGLPELLRRVVTAGVPGVLARVQDGPDIRSAAAGVADLSTGAALLSPARFRVGSVTKTFVAAVVLQLVEEGKLALDEPVGRRLPGLLAEGSTVTVRQLLNHTSGLFDYTADPALLTGIVRNRVFTPNELVAIAERHPVLFPPGSSWAYSNTNYIVAGLLVEATTGQTLAHELRGRIFEPLSLEHTTFPATTSRIPGYHAHGYVSADLLPTPDGRPYDATGLNPSSAWASGAVVSNAADLSRFYRALMSGRLLTASLLREMTTTVAEDPADPDQFRYGLGIERVQDPCGVNWGHGGNIFGYQSAAYWNEQTDRTVVIGSTMFPAPAAAEAALSKLTDFALCGTPRSGAR